MRRAVTIVAVAALAAACGWAGGRYPRTPEVGTTPTGPKSAPVDADVKMAWVYHLPAAFVADRPEAVSEAVGTPTVSRIKFEGQTFWLVDRNRGYGVPYTTIGLYAPTGDGSHALVLEAESCGAGSIKPELDAATGVLVLREHAKSNLDGQIILSCNLRSVGTYQSVHGK